MTRWFKYLLLLFGTSLWSWTMVKSGWVYSYGLGFWGANGHDGIWHIALAENLAKGSFDMPVFAGHFLQNYHIGFDLILALLHKITFIPTANLYFQILPPLFAFLIGLLVYRFVWNWQLSKEAALWSTFFIYFGGSLGWIMGRGESVFWSQQSISTLINPPFALSLIVILVGLIFLVKRQDKFRICDLVFICLLFGLLIEIKVYAGLLVLGSLFVAGIYQLLLKHKFYFLKIFLGSIFVSFLVYIPLNKFSVGLMVFQPFWFLETMMGLSDRIDWKNFYSAMLTYKSGHIWFKAILAYGAAFLIFLIGNFGTRIVLLFKKFKLDELNVFIYSIIGAGILVPMFFLQKGTPWNTIQFFYYSIFFSAVLAGIGVDQFFERQKSKTLTIQYKRLLFITRVLIVLLTIPTTIITLKDVYIPSRPPAMVSKDEMNALAFLAKQPKGIVLTQLYDKEASDEAIANPPRPLYLYTSTAYVSAFSGHQTFFEDEINLDIMGYDWQARKNTVENWYKEKDVMLKHEFLINNNIEYIYWVKNNTSPLDLGKLSLSNIFENNSVTIYQVE